MFLYFLKDLCGMSHSPLRCSWPHEECVWVEMIPSCCSPSLPRRSGINCFLLCHSITTESAVILKHQNLASVEIHLMAQTQALRATAFV